MKTDLISCLFSKFEKYKIILYPRFLSKLIKLTFHFSSNNKTILKRKNIRIVSLLNIKTRFLFNSTGTCFKLDDHFQSEMEIENGGSEIVRGAGVYAHQVLTRECQAKLVRQIVGSLTLVYHSRIYAMHRLACQIRVYLSKRVTNSFQRTIYSTCLPGVTRIFDLFLQDEKKSKNEKFLQFFLIIKLLLFILKTYSYLILVAIVQSESNYNQNRENKRREIH